MLSKPWSYPFKPKHGSVLVHLGHRSMVGMEGFWPLHSAGVGMAYDVSPKRNHGAASGPIQVVHGPYGLMRKFGGAGEFYTLQKKIILDDNDGWTIAFRCRRAGGAPNDGMVLGANDNTTDFIWIRPGTGVNVRPHTTTEISWSGVTDFDPWRTFIVRSVPVMGGLSNKYIDIEGGAQQQQLGTVRGLFEVNALANGYVGSTFDFVGEIDFVAAWRRALSACETRLWMNNPWHIFRSLNVGRFARGGAPAGGSGAYYHFATMGG